MNAAIKYLTAVLVCNQQWLGKSQSVFKACRSMLVCYTVAHVCTAVAWNLHDASHDIYTCDMHIHRMHIMHIFALLHYWLAGTNIQNGSHDPLLYSNQQLATKNIRDKGLEWLPRLGTPTPKSHGGRGAPRAFCGSWVGLRKFVMVHHHPSPSITQVHPSQCQSKMMVLWALMRHQHENNITTTPTWFSQCPSVPPPSLRSDFVYKRDSFCTACGSNRPWPLVTLTL